jgi:hypothetical protein
VTSAVESLMEGKQGTPEHESFAVFDPKVRGVVWCGSAVHGVHTYVCSQ